MPDATRRPMTATERSRRFRARQRAAAAKASAQGDLLAGAASLDGDRAAPLSSTERSRRFRARQRAAAERQRAAVEREAAAECERARPMVEADPAAALAAWARAELVIPPGHPNAGEPMALPAFAQAFLADALAPATHEALLCVARKNAKSATVAVAVLGHLVGPLRRPGWRCGIVSIDREKAGELKRQVEAIARASGLPGLKFRRVGQPAIESSTGAVDVLPALAGAGHASGFDLAIVDELGLLEEKHRGLVASMRSSTSTRAGRTWALTIHGPGPFVPEILSRTGDPALAVHHYRAPEGAALDDPAAWRAANPGIAAGIKTAAYMTAEARRVLASPADQAHFRAHDLNLPQSPTTEPVCTPEQWAACEVEAAALPARTGAAVLGLDLGGSSSATAAAAYWPESRRLETWMAFPADPDLSERGEADGVGGLYARMAATGELRTYPGKVTPVREFLRDLAGDLAGVAIDGVACDRYRQAELETNLAALALPWRPRWRGQGWKDGSEDVRAFQRAVLRGELQCAPSLAMRAAIAESKVLRDPAGNPKLDKARHRGRIDVLQAALLAVSGASAVQPEVTMFKIADL